MIAFKSEGTSLCRYGIYADQKRVVSDAGIQNRAGFFPLAVNDAAVKVIGDAILREIAQ
jgi:hypothetical protein